MFYPENTSELRKKLEELDTVSTIWKETLWTIVEELISHFKHETKLLKKLRRKVKNDIKYSYIDDLVYLHDSNLEIYLTLKYPEFIKTSGKYLYKVLKEHRIERILEYINELRENKNFKKSNMENRINYLNNLWKI